MAIFCIWSGGDGTQTDTTQSASTLNWSKADTTIASLVASYATALTTSGNTIYIASDHVDQETHAANRTFTGPSTGTPVLVVSADRAQSTPTYAASSTNQVDTAKDGAYQIVWSGSFALYGLCMAAGARIQAVGNNGDGFGHVEGCTLKLAANGDVYLGATNSRVIFKNNVIDLTADGSTERAGLVIFNATGWFELSSISFINPGYRTTAVFGPNVGQVLRVSATDFSGFPATTKLTTGAGSIEFDHCKMASAQELCSTSTLTSSGYVMAINCGVADAPESLRVGYMGSTIISDTTVYRTDGASVETVAHSWKVTTSPDAPKINEHAPLYTPWFSGVLAATGSTTFTVHVANNTADLTDAECWMEVEYLGTSDIAQSTRSTDKRSSVTATAASQADDTTSTWNGATLTYMQKLSVTATVGETGLCRARVAIGKASATVYVDPLLVVT